VLFAGPSGHCKLRAFFANAGIQGCAGREPRGSVLVVGSISNQIHHGAVTDRLPCELPSSVCYGRLFVHAGNGWGIVDWSVGDDVGDLLPGEISVQKDTLGVIRMFDGTILELENGAIVSRPAAEIKRIHG